MTTGTLTWIEALEQRVLRALEADDLDAVRALLNGRHPADVAEVIERLDDDDQVRVFRLLSPATAAEVLDETSSDATRELLEQLSPDEVGDLLDRLPMDDVVEILTEDVPERQQALLAEMEPRDAAEVRSLLQYAPQTAGRLMTEKFVRVRPDMTAAETIALLRRIDPEVETLNDLFVLGAQRQLIGVVSLRSVITSSPDQRLDQLMNTQFVTVTPEIDQEEVARIVSRYDLLALPVTAPDGRMLGIVTVDDVVDVLVEEGTEDVLRFGGVEGAGSDLPYFAVPVLRRIRQRVVWLLLLFLAGTLTSSVVQLFDDELAAVIVLSSFIPLLIGTGGNTGAQTVSTVIRGLALGEIRLRDTWRVILRELGNGLLLGLILGAIAFLWAVAWGYGATLAAVVGLSIIAICTWANTIGSVVPLAARKVGIDPATVSAPLITTLVDATGLALYLMIAKVLLNL
ncbi:MAG TPA: magnesium transporter [Roseiflexaceae bacterium]|nr:magnesium transporter [Roseiflexaceae bacterium]